MPQPPQLTAVRNGRPTAIGEPTIEVNANDIWGMHNPTGESWLSLAVVAAFAAAFILVAVRSFSRAALR